MVLALGSDLADKRFKDDNFLVLFFFIDSGGFDEDTSVLGGVGEGEDGGGVDPGVGGQKPLNLDDLSLPQVLVAGLFPVLEIFVPGGILYFVLFLPVLDCEIVVGGVFEVEFEKDDDGCKDEVQDCAEVLPWLLYFAVFEVLEATLDDVVEYVGLAAGVPEANGGHFQKGFVLICDGGRASLPDPNVLRIRNVASCEGVCVTQIVSYCQSAA